ncbi:MAG: ATP-binding protein [Rhodospirillaceae bacterium]
MIDRLLARSLMARAVVLICTLLALTIVLAVSVAVGVTTRDARHALEERAHLTVQVLAGGAAAALGNDDEAAAHALLGTLSLDPDYVGSVILDAGGKPFVQHAIAGPRPPGLLTARAPLTEIIGSNGNRIGTLELTLTAIRAEQGSASRGWAIAAAGCGLLVLVCAALVWIVHGVTRPLLAMTGVMSELAAGRTDVTVPRVPFDDEVGRMAAALATLKTHAAERLEFIARQARHVEETERAVAERTRELSEALDTLRRAQDELLRSEKMAALGGMVAAIAHEINSPLGNSLTIATTLERKIAEFEAMVAGPDIRRSALRGFAEKFTAGGQLLIANLSRAADLIGSFKRVAVDQTSERRRPFDLATTVGEIVTMLRPAYKKTGHRLLVEIPPGIAIDGYPGALSQVVTNLVANALVHAFDGRDDGVVRVTARLEAAGEGVELAVADDGAGIAAEVLPRIFDPFFSTRLGSGGSGLGLHIVYVTVARVLGGGIAVASEPGAGTVFTVRLPRTAPRHDETAA